MEKLHFEKRKKWFFCKVEKIRTFSKLPPTKIFYVKTKSKYDNTAGITDPRRNFERWKIKNWCNQRGSVPVWILRIFFGFFKVKFKSINGLEGKILLFNDVLLNLKPRPKGGWPLGFGCIQFGQPNQELKTLGKGYPKNPPGGVLPTTTPGG